LPALCSGAWLQRTVAPTHEAHTPVSPHELCWALHLQFDKHATLRHCLFALCFQTCPHCVLRQSHCVLPTLCPAPVSVRTLLPDLPTLCPAHTVSCPHCVLPTLCPAPVSVRTLLPDLPTLCPASVTLCPAHTVSCASRISISIRHSSALCTGHAAHASLGGAIHDGEGEEPYP